MDDATDGAQANGTHATNAPLVIDLGKHKRRQVRRLRRGRGKLMGRVSEVLEDLQEAGSISASAQPVIIVVQQKKSRLRTRLF